MVFFTMPNFVVCIAINILLAFAFFTPILTQGTNECTKATQDYLNCIYNGKKLEGVWKFRRPYSFHDGVNRCFLNGCSKVPDYNRSLFADFIKLWQDVSTKTWNEFLNTSDTVKHCMRGIVTAQSKSRIDFCLKGQRVPTLPDGYTEELEAPYCVLETSEPAQLSDMKSGLKEKVALLHQLNECKIKNGVDAAKKTIQCIDSFRLNFTKQHFCRIAGSCLKQKLSTECQEFAQNTVTSICSCSKLHRDSILNKMEFMYRAGSVEILKLTPAFLGLDLSSDSNDQLKLCYLDAAAKPPSFLTTADNPLLNLLKGFQPRPQGMQGLRNLIYAQLDLPDLCDNVC